MDRRYPETNNQLSTIDKKVSKEIEANKNVMPKGKFIPFTKKQEEYIKREYLNKPVKRLADEVNCSFGRIMRFLKKHDLEIPRSVIEKRIQESRRQKGCVPFNKGKKQIEFMSKEAIEKTKATRFKKGNIPHNTKQVNGEISIRKDSSGRFYKHIRVEKGIWELYHRVLWEKHNGSIPKDMIVAFKDKNSMNVIIENLEIISKEENMYRNSKMNYPKEIIPSMVLVNKLDKQLNKLQNG